MVARPDGYALASAYWPVSLFDHGADRGELQARLGLGV